MRHFTALLWATLAGATLGAAGAGGPAQADEPGFSVRITTPATFQAGGTAKTVSAVASSDQLRCRKVRWTLVVTGGKVPLDRIAVTRVENNREFATQVSTQGDNAVIVDERLDPGTLCRNRTVTGQWQIGFKGGDGGEVRLQVRAFDERNTLLTTNGATTEVTSKVATASPTPSKTSASPKPSATTPAEDDPVEDFTPPTEPVTQETSANALVPASSEDSSLLGPGLIVGGVFVGLGLILLLKLRSRARTVRRVDDTLPTGFYTMP